MKKNSYPNIMDIEKLFIFSFFLSFPFFFFFVLLLFFLFYIYRRTFTDIANGDRIPLFKWSPTRNALIYVHKNDIYYQVFFEGGSDTRRITNTGVPDIVFNGIPDWVYEGKSKATMEKKKRERERGKQSNPSDRRVRSIIINQR